jgi:hypothetical protein
MSNKKTVIIGGALLIGLYLFFRRGFAQAKIGQPVFNFKNISFSGGSVYVVITSRNPGSIPVKINSIAVDIIDKDTTLGSANYLPGSTGGISIPSYSMIDFKLKLDLNPVGVIQELLESGSDLILNKNTGTHVFHASGVANVNGINIPLSLDLGTLPAKTI